MFRFGRRAKTEDRESPTPHSLKHADWLPIWMIKDFQPLGFQTPAEKTACTARFFGRAQYFSAWRAVWVYWITVLPN